MRFTEEAMKRVFAFAALVLFSAITYAAYPERPITMLIAYPPGGGTDLVGRAIVPFIEKYLGGGAPIVVVNRSRAGCEDGFAALANSAADGYTIGFVNPPPLLTIPIERAAGVMLRHIRFEGSAAVRAAIPGRQTTVAALNPGEALQYQKGGTPIRNLVQMSPARPNPAPELPTAREQGYDIEMSSLRGLAASKGIPPEVRERLVKAVAQAVADPEFQAQAAKFFAPMRYLAPAEYEALVRDADAMYREMWKDMPWADK